MNFEHIKSIHFVGIGGIGMSGIAEILASRGYTVSGCDLRPSAATDLLMRRGIPVSLGHSEAHIAGVDLLVITSAVRGENAEVDAARRQGMQVVKRKEILGAIVNEKRGVGISGTHGKTTTSAMIAVILEEAGFDPTIVIGGIVRNIGSNAKNGQGAVAVYEADEYDRSFHELHPEIAVVTNIEADHLEYFGDLAAIVEAFRIFVEGIREGGAVVACVDDPTVAELVKKTNHRVIRYGIGDDADLRATNISFDERGSHFEVPGFGWFR